MLPEVVKLKLRTTRTLESAATPETVAIYAQYLNEVVYLLQKSVKP